MRTLVIATAIGLLMALPAAAGDNGCTPDCCGQAVVSDAGCCDPGCCDPGRCGRCGRGCEDCQVVCEMKTIKRHVWVVEYVPICPALPRCGRNDPCGGCDCGCGGCDEVSCASCRGNSCCDPCCGLPTCVTPPKCGHQRTVKRLVRKEVECQVPVYKCVPCCDSGCCDPGCCDPGCCDGAAPAPVEAEGQTTLSAPMPPVIGTSYVK